MLVNDYIILIILKKRKFLGLISRYDSERVTLLDVLYYYVVHISYIVHKHNNGRVSIIFDIII